MKALTKCLFITILFIAASCNNGPKVIEPITSSDLNENTDPWLIKDPSITVTETEKKSFNEDLHRVSVLEVLPTERYVYLQVQEGQDIFWIATRKIDVSKGEVYFYRNGLLKTNFESKEYNKTFDEIYLVSSLVAEDHSKHISQQNSPVEIKKEPVKTPKKEDIPTHTEKNIQHKGTISIAELVKDPKAYEGHTVQLSGICFKVNPNIMERNWLHLKDGSQDDFDLVITSNSFVPEGTQITIKATVALNRDFGAGYTYDLILENGILVQ